MNQSDAGRQPDQKTTPAEALGGTPPACGLVDPMLEGLVSECAGMVDAGLAPLIARELVHPDVADVFAADVRRSLFELFGRVGRAWNLPRMDEAIRIVRDRSAILGVPFDDDSLPCMVCGQMNSRGVVTCARCGRDLTKGAGA